MKLERLISALLLLLAVGCSGDPKVKTTMTLADLENRFKSQVKLDSLELSTGQEVRFTLLTPHAYTGDEPTPLIVALHYGGKVTPHYSRGVIENLVYPGLKELNAIMVAPDSIDGGWGTEANENSVMELMDHVIKNHNIDPSRVLLTGFSLGGHGTWYLGSRHQDRFTAMIPIAGDPYVKEGTTWTTPVYAIHSRADTVVPIKGTEEYIQAQVVSGNQDMELVALEGLPHNQTGKFAAPLKDAVPWLKRVWEKADRSEGP
ncbi:MAG: putative peptidase [Mariniblastus sp.]|jgi:predicted peptidase